MQFTTLCGANSYTISPLRFFNGRCFISAAFRLGGIRFVFLGFRPLIPLIKFPTFRNQCEIAKIENPLNRSRSWGLRGPCQSNCARGLGIGRFLASFPHIIYLCVFGTLNDRYLLRPPPHFVIGFCRIFFRFPYVNKISISW